MLLQRSPWEVWGWCQSSMLGDVRHAGLHFLFWLFLTSAVLSMSSLTFVKWIPRGEDCYTHYNGDDTLIKVEVEGYCLPEAETWKEKWYWIQSCCINIFYYFTIISIYFRKIYRRKIIEDLNVHNIIFAGRLKCTFKASLWFTRSTRVTNV